MRFIFTSLSLVLAALAGASALQHAAPDYQAEIMKRAGAPPLDLPAHFRAGISVDKNGCPVLDISIVISRASRRELHTLLTGEKVQGPPSGTHEDDIEVMGFHLPKGPGHPPDVPAWIPPPETDDKDVYRLGAGQFSWAMSLANRGAAPKKERRQDVGTALFQSGKEYVYDYTASLMAGSEDYVGFASAVNFTGELHIQGGASVLNVQLNNVKLGMYNGEWSMNPSPS